MVNRFQNRRVLAKKTGRKHRIISEKVETFFTIIKAKVKYIGVGNKKSKLFRNRNEISLKNVKHSPVAGEVVF